MIYSFYCNIYSKCWSKSCSCNNYYYICMTHFYLLIPLFATSKSLSKPTLNLSEPFLVDNKSNPYLIAKFILDQWKDSGFNLKREAFIIIKFKRVWINYK
nr:hypothetical protein [Russula griseocarnosa]